LQYFDFVAKSNGFDADFGEVIARIEKENEEEE
jgi:hypothetical protein